jgi:IclR family acetate operon transcriptional repressor
LAEPALLELQASTRETVNLGVVRGRRIVYASIIEGTYGMRMSAAMGQEVPAHATALGKAILSRLPDWQAHAILGGEPFQAFTGRTKTWWADLEPELTTVRARGYSEDHEEVEPYVRCVAAPIVGPDGRAMAAISVSALSPRMSKSSQWRVAMIVRAKAEEISRKLGYQEATETHAPAKTPRQGGSRTY